jgi:hypothetical protein
VGPDLDEILDNDTLLCIDVGKSSDIGLVSQFQVIFMANEPKIPGQFALGNDGMFPVPESHLLRIILGAK